MAAGRQHTVAWARWHGGKAQAFLLAAGPVHPCPALLCLCAVLAPVPHAQHHVDVAAHAPGVGSHEVGLGGRKALFLERGPHGVDNLVLLVQGIEVGNVTRVQDVVDVLQEGLVLDLRRDRGGGTEP